MALISDIDNVISIGEIRNGKFIEPLVKDILISGFCVCIAWMPKGDLIAIGGSTGSIALWDTNFHKIVRQLEGHSDLVKSVSFSSDGRLLATKSRDGTVCLWRCDNWEMIAKIDEETSKKFPPSIAFHPTKSSVLATLGQMDSVIRLWDINYDALISNSSRLKSIHYTTAKLVLVGDSGVGKTGLGWRLAHGEFKEHASTHGQQFWAIPELGKKRQDGVECEAVLWDLAGQHVYRQIHSIFLENVDAALVLFDPSNRQDPLKGAQFWLEQLRGKGQLPPTVLVGARVDRGAPALSQADLDQFCQKYGIKGGYISTSAMTGEGLDELLKIVKAQIPWDEMIATVTTVTFKRIKDAVLALKEKPDRKGVLVSIVDLAEQLHVADPDWQFGDVEVLTAVGHLENHGFVTILYSSSGKQHILLVPELLANLASSIVLLADKHTRELGSVSETELLQGKYLFDELKGLDKNEQQILIEATVLRFLQHNICFRETLGNETLLIFPNLIKLKRPLIDEFESADDVSYIVRGRVENIYAALAVLLGYTTAFTRINQWQNQAQYEMGTDQICGFRLSEEREGELELVLYYSTAMPAFGRNLFQGLFESFLYRRDVEVTRVPPVFCSNKHRIERTTVIKRVRDGKDFAFCDECGGKTPLPEIEKPEILGGTDSWHIRHEEALAKLRSTYETHLTRIKSFRSDRSAPRCYISHADDDFEWVVSLVHDLWDAGIFVLEDRLQVKPADFILQICTPEYKQAWDAKLQRPGEDARIVQAQLKAQHVIPLLRAGNSYNSTPRESLVCRGADFSDASAYVLNLFDLVLSLYAIPLNHPAFENLRDALQKQWEQTVEERFHLANRQVFISYAWGEDRESIVNELDREFQWRGVTIVRDKRDLGFKGSIKEFMETIGEGKAVVLVISEKYLKSPNCCFELVQIAKNGAFRDRIFPIVLEDAKIYDPVDRIRYVKHWEGKQTELDAVMKQVSAANLQGFREDIDLYAEIRALLPNLMDVLKNMNALTPDLHRESGFSEIFEAVMAKLDE
jgi:small GTP-binding protein